VPVVIAQEHTWSYEGNPVRVWLDGRVIGRLVTRFVAVSAADGERMVRIERVPAEKVVVIPSGYVPRTPGPAGDLRAELGLAPGTPLIGTAAVMRPQKALEVLLEAHALVLRTVPGTHLALAGFGECRPALEAVARQLGIEATTHFLGRRVDVDSILQSLDVAAMSSDYEGAPLFVYECMANRTPLVATAVGGLPDIVEDGRTGLLVPPRRADMLAAALAGLLEDPDWRGRLADAAAQRLEQFTIERIAERFAGLYERLAAESAPARARSRA
jgi:glycosyltransferase involved in cell wall biosynthesis